MPLLALSPAILAASAAGCLGGQEVTARLGEEFVLAVGQEARLSGEDLVISFLGVTEDSRCPRDVTCVWEGRVVCSVEVRTGGASERLELAQPGLTAQAANTFYGEYQLRFTVAPYPQADSSIATEEYRLRLTVTR